MTRVSNPPSSHEHVLFEDGVKRLEEVVRQLEEPTVTLDMALELFGEGVALVRRCQAQLSQAEERMAVLMEHSDGSLGLEETDRILGMKGSDDEE
ncbi:MAG: exodeoxyribonuclease VII small subunit [Peptococcaceae bacterium]|nr:exodeoxyribonuclease VII small subunit [Peptococcaceae bacterium]